MATSTNTATINASALPRLVFRAMVFHRGNRWYAECVDLSLAVFRSTAEEAIAALQDQMGLHVTTVLEERLPISLLHRPSPLSHRIRYWLLPLQGKLAAILHHPPGISLQIEASPRPHA